MIKKFLILLTALILVLVLTACSSAKKSVEPVIENNSNISDTDGNDESHIDNKPSDTPLDTPSATPTDKPVVTPNVPDITNDTTEENSDKDTTNNTTTNTGNKSDGKKEDNQDKTTTTKDDKKQPTPTPKLIPVEEKESTQPKNDNKTEPTKVPAPTYMPIYKDSELSLNSPLADTSLLYDYKETLLSVYKYTDGNSGGNWQLTKSFGKDFYIYTGNGNTIRYTEEDPIIEGLPLMRRSYLKGNKLIEEFLYTEYWFQNPYEDESGNIYAEVGRTSPLFPYSQISIDKLFIVKMNSKGSIINKICVGDYESDDLEYDGFYYLRKDTIALIFEKTSSKSWEYAQIIIIDLNKNEVNATIKITDKFVGEPFIKSDGNHFILSSRSFEKVFVYDTHSYELVNTIDTTKCKELSAYELDTDTSADGYTRISYSTDIRDGKVYFLRHSGIYVTDYMKSEFYKLVDGSNYDGLRNQNNTYTSFSVGSNEEFYILGTDYNAESATHLWCYRK